jgi:hypothetical protein
LVSIKSCWPDYRSSLKAGSFFDQCYIASDIALRLRQSK